MGKKRGTAFSQCLYVFIRLRQNSKTRILSYKTGTLNTLYQVSLTEQVNYYQGSYNKQTRSVLYNVLVLRPSCHSLEYLKGLGRSLVYVRHKVEFTTVRPEQVYVELIRPLPGE